MTDTVQVRVPNLGEFSDVPIAEVLIKPGDTISINQALLVLESDKAAMEVPSPMAGIVKEVIAQRDEHVSEGALILLLEPASDGKAEVESDNCPEVAVLPAAPAPTEPIVATDSVGTGSATAVPDAATHPTHESPRRASPAVRKLARELGVDLSAVTPSGSQDRILREDIRDHVKNALARRPAPPLDIGEPGPVAADFEAFGPVETIKLTRIQRISGPHLQRAWRTIPHVTSQEEADITDLDSFRLRINTEQSPDRARLTVLAFVIKAVVSVLQEFPAFNSSLVADELCLKHYYHVGFAAETPNGLIVPVVRDADRLGVSTIAAELARLSASARNGRLGPAEMQGGTFTVSSLGGIGGTGFTPIINAPEVAILGVSRAARKPVWDGSAFVPRLILPLSLSWDHRVVDGASAARFNARLAELLMDPWRLLL